MKPHARELLPEYVLGALSADETAELERQLRESPELQRELDELTVALAQVVVSLAPVDPSPDTRTRLLDTVAGADRFAPFLAPLGRILDLSVEAVRAVLARIDEAAAWLPALPGVQLMHFDAGPQMRTADAGLIRLAPGASFPRHRHLGHEVNYVLEGAMCDGDQVHGPGAVVVYDEHSEHLYTAAPERELVLMTVHHGIQPLP
jgi:anti-sigma factor ChrR (cupin superfamily)